jgi:predicted transcriptional regulator
VVNGVVVGRDDMDNILLLDTTGIRSIPKKKVIDVASKDLITLKPSLTIKEAAKVLTTGGIEGAPVITDGEILGILTLSDIAGALAQDRESLKVIEIMSNNIITVKEDVMISEAIDIMNKNNIGRLIVVNGTGAPQGIVTRTDLLDKIASPKIA